MKLNYAVLDYLIENDNGKFVDLTFFNEDREALKVVINELKSRHLIVTDNCKPRDFKAFGISEKVVTCIRAKITMRGKIYFTSKNNNKINTKKKKESFKLTQYLNFI